MMVGLRDKLVPAGIFMQWVRKGRGGGRWLGGSHLGINRNAGMNIVDIPALTCG